MKNKLYIIKFTKYAPNQYRYKYAALCSQGCSDCIYAISENREEAITFYEEKLFERIDHYLKDIFEIKDLAKNHLKMIKVYEIKDSAKNIKFDKNGDYVFAQ